MTCAPNRNGAVSPAEAFDFSNAPSTMARSMQNATILWTAPWRAWWALAAEATNPGGRRF